ncbi:MAG: hypothetical protein KDC48_21510 [Planctomycetes bacterium]|nr:hypothetical protein [Planctomycetota bacterium]
MTARDSRQARFLAAAASLLAMSFIGQPVQAAGEATTKFRAVRPIQYIAALGAPEATSGDNAQAWGLWVDDPGPRGVWLENFPALVANGGVAPANWQFDGSDWWLEEHGLIMEAPTFSLPPGKYLVTGGRETSAVLTIHPPGADGSSRWELGDGATLLDVTHLRCRSARYTPASDGGTCSPAQASQRQFPVEPGAIMPPVPGCAKQDYAVLFIVGLPL